jgi:hypothetical protein
VVLHRQLTGAIVGIVILKSRDVRSRAAAVRTFLAVAALIASMETSSSPGYTGYVLVLIFLRPSPFLFPTTEARRERISPHPQRRSPVPGNPRGSTVAACTDACARDSPANPTLGHQKEDGLIDRGVRGDGAPSIAAWGSAGLSDVALNMVTAARLQTTTTCWRRRRWNNSARWRRFVDRAFESRD